MSNKQQLAEEVNKVIEKAKNIPKNKMVFTYKGVLYPTASCDIDKLKAFESFEICKDDLMLAAYPKCGFNWCVLILHSMVHIVHNKEPSAIIPLIEFQATHTLEKIKAEPSPRVLGTHLKYENIPQSFFEKKVKMLVVLRNPKDAAVSLFHFYNNNPTLPNYNSWDEFFPDFMTGKVVFGSYFDYAVAWNKHFDDTNLLITFEDIKEDLEGSIKKISGFFGFSLTEAQVNEIADKGTFKSMKENSKQTHGDIGEAIFRKGDVGDWKNHFSVAQSQEMDAKFEECLAGTKIGEMLKYKVYCKW